MLRTILVIASERFIGSLTPRSMTSDLRSNILQGFFPDLECGSFLVGKFGLDNLESVIEYGVSCVLFSVIHQVVDELGDAHVVEHGIG